MSVPPADPAGEPLRRLVERTSRAIVVVFAALLVVLLALLERRGPELTDRGLQGMPLLVVLAAAAAFWMARRGRPRLGVALVIAVGYLTLVYYVVATGYGLKSYTLSLYLIAIIIAGLLIGPRAGAAATALGVATVLGLYAAEQHWGFMHPGRIADIPLLNVALVYVVAYLVAGWTNVAFGRSFADVLQRAGIQERQLREQFEASPVGHVIHRGDRALMANEAVWGRLGLPGAAGFLGRSMLEFVPPADHQRVRAQWARAIEAGVRARPQPEEYRVRLGDGRDMVIATYVLPLDLPDGPALMTIMLDVTRERRAAEDLAVAKEQAERASRVKSEFLANMSHEIRTPLNGIIGLAQMVLAPELPEDERQRYLRQILDSSRSLNGVLADVLDLSKIEAGKLAVERIAFDLARELAGLGELYASAARAKGLDFELTIADSLPARVLGDPVRLRQVVGNLLSNAVKFTAAGKVVLSAEGRAGTRVRITVSDTGVGIDEAVRARLFQPFEQADTSTTRRFGGTGLGLALSRQLVELMAGRIELDSELGHGSRFVVELPLPEAAGEPRPEPAPAAPRLAGRRLLLVEDNTVNEVVAVAALERLGARVRVARNGVEAVAAVLGGQERIDAVLMDLQMPEMDGYEATALIRRQRAAADLPIIAMTAAALVEERQLCIESGMNDFVAKPFDIDQLAVVLGRWLDSRPAAAPPTPG